MVLEFLFRFYLLRELFQLQTYLSGAARALAGVTLAVARLMSVSEKGPLRSYTTYPETRALSSYSGVTSACHDGDDDEWGGVQEATRTPTGQQRSDTAGHGRARQGQTRQGSVLYRVSHDTRSERQVEEGPKKPASLVHARTHGSSKNNVGRNFSFPCDGSCPVSRGWRYPGSMLPCDRCSVYKGGRIVFSASYP